jgi:hypothetical protein
MDTSDTNNAWQMTVAKEEVTTEVLGHATRKWCRLKKFNRDEPETGLSDELHCSPTQLYSDNNVGY